VRRGVTFDPKISFSILLTPQRAGFFTQNLRSAVLVAYTRQPYTGFSVAPMALRAALMSACGTGLITTIESLRTNLYIEPGNDTRREHLAFLEHFRLSFIYSLVELHRRPPGGVTEAW